MDLENLGQSAAELKIAFETLQDQIKNNAKLLAQLTGDAARGFEPSISKAKILTDELTKANKQSLSNYKERLQFESKLQQAQKELVGLARQRNILTSRLSVATNAERIQLFALIDNYNELIYSSQELVDNTKKLKEELQPINDNIGTKLMGAVSDLSSKIPGLSRFSGPFKEASEAAEKMATQNQLMFGSVQGISKAQLESLKTGRGLSAEFAKQLGLVDRNGNALRGAAAANKARTSGILATAEKSMSPLMTGIKTLGPALSKAFAPMFFVLELFKVLKSADTATGDLAKDFNLTYNSAAKIRNELIDIGTSSSNIALNARALQESMVAVGKSLGSNAVLNQADLETFTELREMAGYTNEELIGIQKLTLAIGGNLKDNTKQFLGTVAALNAQNKLTINEKQLLKEVSNTSAAIKLSIGGTTKELAASAFQAKQFGINLDQANKIAESLLDFESSITNELSAELIIGRGLNLEKARLLSLNGDIAGASAEILKQVKGSAEFTNMNRIQQEALAKAVGMSREELAASLIEREALQSIGAKDAASAKIEFEILAKKYGYDKAITMLGNEQYATQLKQQSIQERMNMAVMKMQELFVAVAEPVLEILSPLMDLVNVVLPLVMSSLQPILGTFKTIAAIVTGIVRTLTGDFSGALDSFTSIPSIIEKSTKAGLGGKILSSITGIKMAEGGIVSPRSGGVNVTVAEAGRHEAIIPLNSPSANKYLNNKQTHQDLSPLLEEIKAMRQEAARSNNKQVIVENSMDGTKFGTSVAMNTYKTQ